MDAMISLQVGSTEKIARELNTYLKNKGYTTWICVEMQGGATYREEIVVNASGSKTLIALMNVKWAESKECRYEFNIALRSQLTKGFPQIIPVLLETFDWNNYPIITGVMANANGIFYDAKNPTATWELIVASLSAFAQPKSPDVSIPKQVEQVLEELPQDISEWKIEHVSRWFQSLKLPHSSKEIFEANWVDGPMLLELKEVDMKESMKLTSLQAKRLAREINALVLKPNHSISSSSSSSSSSSILRPIVKGQPRKLPATASLHSNKGFATGIWEGYFIYDSGKKSPTSMDVTMVAGVVAGYGSDEVGDFLVQGTYNDSDLTIRWDKSYVGKHVVYYEGKINTATHTINGKWDIPGNWSGGFTFTWKK